MLRDTVPNMSYPWVLTPRVAAVVLLLLLPAFCFAQTNCEEGNSSLNANQKPQIAVEELIRKFSANDASNKEARTHYSYTEDVTVQTLDGKNVDGEYRTVTNVTLDASGKAVRTDAVPPQNSLRRLSVTEEDLNDLRGRVPFMLTTAELPQYKVTYAGTQHVDEIDAYVFDVSPLKLEAGNRYFQGRIWVEDHNLQIVKACGNTVPDTPDNQSPKFVTYREQIDGRYWFPTYARADDVLHFSNTDVHLREIVKYTKYKSGPNSGMPSGTPTAQAK
jgi:hypothetical protein